MIEVLAEPAATDEMMLRDNDNSQVLIERLDRDLEKTKHRLENKTKTIDRLLDQLDLKNKAIQDLKVDAKRRCESKTFSCLFYLLYYSSFLFTRESSIVERGTHVKWYASLYSPVFIRHPVPSTDQALPSCFYFRIS